MFILQFLLSPYYALNSRLSAKGKESNCIYVHAHLYITLCVYVLFFTVLFFKDISLPKELNLKTIMIVKYNKCGICMCKVHENLHSNLFVGMEDSHKEMSRIIRKIFIVATNERRNLRGRIIRKWHFRHRRECLKVMMT